MWAWVITISWMSSTPWPVRSRACSRWPIVPRSCMPVSTSTMPSPDWRAQALAWGTPGRSRGRRSRHTPGSTRSPRPCSRGRVGLRTAKTLPSRPMAKKSRLKAPEFSYGDPSDSVLVLRGSMTPATRLQYAEVVSGNILSREDAWHRAVEFLFERLAVRWVIAGAPPIAKQKQLLERYRFASQEERRFIRESLRAHLAEPSPAMEAP